MKNLKKFISLIIVLTFLLFPLTALATGGSVYNQVDYSPVYDYQYYKNNNRDLRKAFGNDEEAYLRHFVQFGMEEGRRGNEVFDVTSYMYAHPDLRAAFGRDKVSYYIHYINYGRFEKRVTNSVYDIVRPTTTYKGINLSSIYDYQYYIENHSDLRKAYKGDDQAALAHFVNFGVMEGRIAKEDYDLNVYKKLQAISKNMGDAPTSYCGVDLSSVYDYLYYMWNNRDVAVTFNYDPDLAIKHFGEHGIVEGRKAKYLYDKATYDALREQVKNIPLTLLNMANTINQYATTTGYAIAVDKNTKQVGVFTGKKGSYSLVKQFPCATGAQRSPTPNGVYYMGARGLYFNTGTRGRCWYYTQIKGNYLFHSQIYDRQNRPVNIIDGAMGAAVSHGCIRLYLDDAKWLYDNMPSGTTIVVY